MENKQTAVDFFLKEMSDIIGIVNTDAFQNLLMVEAYNKAKQMEAMQLESCAIHFTDYATECIVLHKQMDGEKHFEQYYFNNYGN